MAKDARLFARFDLDYADHPKIVALSDSAFRAHVEMILYARKYMTDGYIPKRVANRLGFESLSELLNNDPEHPSLVETDDGQAYYLHGYGDMNETKAEIEQRTARNRANGARGGRPKGSKKTRSVSQSVSDSAPQSRTQNLTQKKAETETETETDIYPYKSPTGDGKRGGYTEAFERFWKVYPKSADKRTAFNAWKRAVKRADPETIMAGAERYRDDPNRDPAYTKNGSTWLNADAWLNDPLPPRGGSGPQTFDQQRIQANNDLFMEIAGSVAGGDVWNSDSFNRQIQQ